MVRPSELESPTPAMSRRYSNQLSYGRTFQNILTGIMFDSVLNAEDINHAMWWLQAENQCFATVCRLYGLSVVFLGISCCG